MQLLPLLITAGDPPAYGTGRGIPFFLFLTGDPGGAAFPTQYAGRRIWDGAMVELCLVAVADAPAGMGGQYRVRKGGVTYAAYLVETTDPLASTRRIDTTTGTKAWRIKT